MIECRGRAGYALGVLLSLLARGAVRLLALRVTVGERQGQVLGLAVPALALVAALWTMAANIRSQAVTARAVGLTPLTPGPSAGGHSSRSSHSSVPSSWSPTRGPDGGFEDDLDAVGRSLDQRVPHMRHNGPIRAIDAAPIGTPDGL